MRRPILGDSRFANSDIKLIKMVVYFCRDVLEALKFKVRSACIVWCVGFVIMKRKLISL